MTSAETLSQYGLHNAEIIVQVAEETGVPLWIAAAYIEKESGGRNVYGNDYGGVYSISDPLRPNPNNVTETNFKAFERRVLDGEISNGVGPCQITYPGFIKQAKEQGVRLWVPLDNIRFGFNLIKSYLRGRIDDQTIREAGTLYNAGNLLNGVNAYGDDLLGKARIWRTRLEGQTMALLKYPSKSAIKTDAFWEQLEKVERQNGVTITCGPSFVKAGYCAKGKHGHWDQSRHWPARALDMSMDPKAGVPISDYEKTHLTAKALMLRARYGTAIGLILNRASDHKDHLHGDDGQSGYQIIGVYDYKAIGDELIFGRNGKRVEEWQMILDDAGYKTSIDGNFGLQTYDNTRQAQYDWGLRPDAIVGPSTLSTGKAKAKKTTTPAKPPAPKPEPKPAPTVSTSRISGPNRYDTAVAVSKAAFPRTAPVVYLATTLTDDVGLSGKLTDGPTLLCAKGGKKLPSATAAEIRRLKPKKVTAVGGNTGVTAAALKQAGEEAAKK